MEQVSNVVQYINERKRLGESQQKIVDIHQSIEDCPVSFLFYKSFFLTFIVRLYSKLQENLKELVKLICLFMKKIRLLKLLFIYLMMLC